MKTRVLGILGCLCLIVCFSSPANALYRKPDLEPVQVDRLVKNMESMIKKGSKNVVNIRYNLARVYAMAYALKVDSCQQVKERPSEGAWFGFTPSAVPFKAVTTDDKAKQDAAKKNLNKAIQAYTELVTDQPNHLPAQLGLAWCLEQAGKKDDAIKGYREVATKGWEQEYKLKSGPLGGNFLTKEAANYLIPLLDAQKDEREIDDLKARVGILNKLPRPVTPIAVPLKDGLAATDLEDKSASVLFDADGTGLDRRWTWINKDAAWLVHDPLQTGKITSGLQLFGNVTFWCFWANGYEALSALDDNSDGTLRGAELTGLALWHDVNANGVCDAGEVRSLSEHGIVALACDWQTDAQHADRIAFSPRGVTFQNGATRPTFDLILRQR